MKCWRIGVWLVPVVLAVAVGSTLRADGPTRLDTRDCAVVMSEMRIWDQPGLDSKVLVTVHCGDLVTVLGPRERSRVRVKADDVIGWMYTSGLVALSTQGADARLLQAAHEKEQPPNPLHEPDHLAALALYSRHIEFFPDSEYAAFALYRFGQMGDRLAAEATKEAKRQLPREQERWDASSTDWEGLQKYTEWGLTLDYSHLGGHYFYGGAAYRRIVEKHARSEWADDAAFRLLKLVRERVGEWEGWPQEPLKELDLWTEFVEKHPRSELKPQALLEMVYLNRVLHEIHSHSAEGFADPEKAKRHLEEARKLCKSIQRGFPRTIFAARAEKNLAELAEGGHVYLFGAGLD